MAMGLAMGIAKWKRRVRFWREHVRRAGLLSEEMESHLAMKVADLMEAGMTERDARSEARRQFGNVTRQMEESRAVWIARWMTDLVQDVCFAARTFRKQPGFTAAAVKPGCLRNVRAAKQTSCTRSVIHRAIQTARDSSIWRVTFPNWRRASLRASRSVIPASIRSATFIAR